MLDGGIVEEEGQRMKRVTVICTVGMSAAFWLDKNLSAEKKEQEAKRLCDVSDEGVRGDLSEVRRLPGRSF